MPRMQTMVENLTNFPMMAVVEKLIEKPIHPWDLKPQEAKALQARLSRHVVRQSRINFEDINTVAGVDAGYRNNTACAAVVVMNLTDLRIVDKAVAANLFLGRRLLVDGGPGADEVRGGPGHDLVAGSGGDDLLRGDSGDDVLRGGSGNDELFGDEGDDEADGGDGEDRCYAERVAACEVAYLVRATRSRPAGAIAA